MRIDVGHGGVLPHFDTQSSQGLAGGIAQLLRERRQDRWSSLDKDDARGTRVDGSEFVAKRLPRDLRERAGQLDAGWAAADQRERQQLPPARRIGFAFRALERQQHAAADLERIFKRLQSWRVGLPLGVTEIGVARAGRDDQIVVVDAVAVG